MASRDSSLPQRQMSSKTKHRTETNRMKTLSAKTLGGEFDITNYHIYEKSGTVSDAIGWLMSHKLPFILCFFFIWFVLIIGGFGLLFLIDAKGIVTPNGDEAGPLECCWLSLQTFTTIGYGSLYPRSKWAHFMCAANGFVGQLYSAVLTMVFLAHLIRPVPHWKLSNVVTVYTDEKKGEMVMRARLVVAPGRAYFDLQAVMQVEIIQASEDGDLMSSFACAESIVCDLPLEHDNALIRTGHMTLEHVIDKDSALFSQIKHGKLHLNRIKIVTIRLEAKDPKTRETATTIKQFDKEKIMVNHRFRKMLVADRQGQLTKLDASKISETKPSSGRESFHLKRKKWDIKWNATDDILLHSALP